MAYKIREGNYERCGVQAVPEGMIFTFKAEKEENCAILLYAKNGDLKEHIPVPSRFCRGAIRSVCVLGLSEHSLRYNYEISGRVVTDLHARRIIGRECWNDPKRRAGQMQVCGGYSNTRFDWDGDVPPEVPRSQMVMYKLHVRGFTMNAGIRGRERGTFGAVEERIPYLKELGITTVEFMPVYEFEEIIKPVLPQLPEYVRWEEKRGDIIRPKAEPGAGDDRVNYWGYVPGNYYAVKSAYASGTDAASEWKSLIRALHRNGMECVMEMYFGEPQNQNLIVDLLRYWVREFHVDGFHLQGEKLPITQIAQDAWLKRTKIFYTGFDAMLLEERCRYPHLFLYSDEYLYPVRGMLNNMHASLEGFLCQQRKQHRTQGFVNYIADNNGFTLLDLFSYAEKHNQENGENNRDGSSWNLSNNYGVEGRTMKRQICELRELKLRNAIAILMLAQGVPLLFQGDERGNTQDGNNNAYCQDNAVGWLNWKKTERYGWLVEFTRQMIAFRMAHPVISSEEPKQLSDSAHRGFPDLSYHGENAWIGNPSAERRVVGVLYCGGSEQQTNGTVDDFVYVGYNFQAGLYKLALPKLPERKSWYLVMDTARGKEAFLVQEEKQAEPQIMLKGQSVILLVGK